jgi:hypothetical protein
MRTGLLPRKEGDNGHTVPEEVHICQENKHYVSMVAG